MATDGRSDSPDPFGDDFPADAAFLDAVASLSALARPADTSSLADGAANPADPARSPASPVPTIAARGTSSVVRHVDVELALDDGEGQPGPTTRSSTTAAACDGGGGTSRADGPASSSSTSRIVMDVDEVVGASTSSGSHPPAPPPPSLYKSFRSRRGYFSVTDLCAPSWCEVQYDYGLRGQRYLPVAERPASFVSARGQTITPNVAQATANAKIMDAGSAVHKRLEREIHPVEVRVDVATREERWALRLLNMLAAVEALLQLGICREMPVMGFVKGEFVVGIVDEIQRRPLPAPPATLPPPPPSPPPPSTLQLPSSPRLQPPPDAAASRASDASTSQPVLSTPTRSSPRKKSTPVKPSPKGANSPKKAANSPKKAASASSTPSGKPPPKGARTLPRRKSRSPSKPAAAGATPAKSPPKPTKITSFFRPKETGPIVLLDDDSDDEVMLLPPPPPIRSPEQPSSSQPSLDSSQARPAAASRAVPPQLVLSDPPPSPPQPPPLGPPTVAEPTPAAHPPPTHALFVSDSKTRRSYSLPRDDAALSGKLQVQIYKLLLDDLLAPSAGSSPPPAEPSTSILALLFAHLNLDQDARLSDGFCAQAQDLIDGNSIAFDWQGDRALTLSLLANCWDKTVDRLGIDRAKGVDDELQLVYLYQSAVKKSAGKGKRKRKAKRSESGPPPPPPSTADEEDRQLQLAIAASLAAAGIATASTSTVAAVGQASGASTPSDDQQLQLALQMSLAAVDSCPLTPSDPGPSAPPVATPPPAAGASDSTLKSPPSSQPGATRAVHGGSAVELIDNGPVEVAEGAFDPPPAPLRLGPTESSSAPEPLSTSPSIIVVEKMLQPSDRPPPLPPAAPTKKEEVALLMKLKLFELRVLARKEGLPDWGAKNILADRIYKARVERAKAAAKSARASSTSQRSPPEKRPRTTGAPAKPAGPPSPPSVVVVAPPAAASARPLDDDVIGVKTFRHAPAELDAHLTRVLDFWHGARQPVGVPEAETWKCNSCELRESCEWRAGEADRIWLERSRARSANWP